MIRCFALLTGLLACSSLAHAQWNAKKIEAFAGEFRLVADTLPSHKSGQMLGALASLGVPDAKETLKAMDSIVDGWIAKPADLKLAIKGNGEAVKLVNQAFNAYAAMGDYERATKLLIALDKNMWLLGAETAFLEAPYGCQTVLAPLIVSSVDRAPMLAAMMKGAARAGNFQQVDVHMEELIALTKEKRVAVSSGVLDRLLDLKFYSKAVELLEAAPRSQDFAKQLVEVGSEAFRGGDFEALDRIATLISAYVKDGHPQDEPELVWIQTIRSKEPEKVIQDVEKKNHPSTYRFFRCVQRHAEALMLRAQFSKVQALLATYPANQEAILRGVLVTQARVEDLKGAEANIKLLPRRLMALEFLIEQRYFDEAAALYDEIGKDLEARDQFYCARNLAKGFLELGKVDRAVVYLEKAKARLLTPDTRLVTSDSSFSDLATLFGQTGDLATLKELLAKRKANDYPKPAEALQESFMAAFRAGLIRK